MLRFVPVQRRKIRDRNVVAPGFAAGFLEPLKSTNIYLIQSGIARLVNLFPDREFNPAVIDRYNAQTAFEIERIRDFIILHYVATERDDTPLWNHCRTMDIPDELAENIRLFRDSGRFYRNAEELFALTSWVEVMIGQRILPRAWHSAVDQLSDAELKHLMDDVQRAIAACADAMSTHEQSIARSCAAVWDDPCQASFPGWHRSRSNGCPHAPRAAPLQGSLT